MSSPCQINRWKLSRALNRDSGLSNPLQQHIDSCDSCRQFYRANQSVLSLSGASTRPPADDERRARIMRAVRTEAQKQTRSPRVFMEQVTRFGPAFAGAAAACLLVVWLAFPPASNTEAENEAWLQFPGVVTRAAQSQYEAELAKLQRDLSRSALFVRSAATPMEILGRE